MATMTTTPALPKLPTEGSLRTRMEALLLGFYSVVGIVPRRNHPLPNNLLTESFQGRFFIAATSELICYSKEQMLNARVGRGGTQRPQTQLLSMHVVRESEGRVTVTYVAAFRYGCTATVRRGSFKAVETLNGWSLRSIDEDVRVVLLFDNRRRMYVPPADRPRVWIL